MADRTVRVVLLGDASSLVGAANAARAALASLARVNIGSVTTSIRQAGAASSAAAQQAQSFAKTLKTGFAAMGLQAGITGIVQGFRSFITAGLEYQGNMNTLHAVTGANDTQMRMLGERAKQLGADIEIPGASAADAAEAMKELAKGGLSVNQAMGAARGTLMLAAAAQVSAAQAATIQAKALNAFRLEATEASHVADVLANGANAASGEVTDMAMGLQQSATVAHGFGISLDDTATTLALFAKNGVIGSDAGTSFKTMLQQLASPTKQQRLAMEDLGLTIYDARGQFMGMESITDQLSQAHQRLTVQQYNSAASTLFGTDAIRAANILGEEGTKGWNKMADAVLKEGGAKELAAAQTIGLNGALNAFTNVVSTASQEVFDKLQPAMVGIVSTMTSVASAIGGALGWFQMLPGPIQGVVVGLGMMILLKGPLKALWLGMKEGAWATMSLKISMLEAGMGANFLQVGIMRVGMAMKGLMATFVANPFGWILLAASTIIPMFIDITEDATDAITDYSDAIDINTGKLKENASASIAESGKNDADKYRAIGGGMGEWTAALLGNVDAQNAVHTAILAAATDAAIMSGAYSKAVLDGTIPATMSANDYATSLLNGTHQTTVHSDALNNALNVNKLYSSAVQTLGSAIDINTGKTQEEAAAEGILAASGQQVTASHSDMEKAIKSVNDEMGSGASPMIAFKARIDAAKHSMDFADLAAQSLTISLLNMSGSNLTAEQAARANDAAMRMVATSARQHAQAVDEIAKKQEDLNELEAGDPEQVEKAQKSADKAAKSAQEAQEDQAKSAQQSAKQIADAQKDLDKARKQSDKSIAEAQKRYDAINGKPETTSDQINEAIDNLREAHENGAEQIEQAQQRIADAQDSAADTAKSASERAAEAADSAAEAQDGVNEAQENSVPSSMELSSAQRAIKDAEDAAAASADSHADAIDKAGQSARDMAAAAYANKAAQGDMAGGIVDATAVMQIQHDKFVESAIAAGYSGTEAEEMARKQGLIPENVKTTYLEDGFDAAILKADALNKKLLEIDGKTVHFTANGTIVAADVQSAIPGLDASVISAIPGLGLANLLAQRQASGDTQLTAEQIAILVGGGAPRHADGGFITGPGGPRDDKIKAPWLSNGEFVVNAASTAKWRPFLELINNGFADGGMVATASVAAPSQAAPVATAAPDASAGVAAWAAIAAAMVAAWNAQMLPVFDSLTARNDQLGKEFQTLNLDWTTPAWTQIGLTVSQTWSTVVQPTYDQLNAGSVNVGNVWSWLNRDAAQPSFTGIRTVIADSWNGTIAPVYGQMNDGSRNVGDTFTTLSATTATAWGEIGTTIANVYNGQIVPAWTGVQGFVTSVGTFFAGAQTGMTTAATSVTTDLVTITTKIDEFFKMVDTKAPVAAPAAAAGATPATVSVPVNAALADGGPITMGTTGRADDVLVRVSKGEYVVNAKAAAAHRPELDSINYGGAYADGGMIGEKIGNRVGTNILDGAQRAISAGVDRVLATVPATSISGTSTATGFNPSQDPSSFGWVRAANQVPYSWQGRSFGEAAAGTAGLWNALLDFLAPLIPGGINSNVGIFENRSIAGTSTPSFHSYGLAMDINSDANGRGLPGYGRTGLYEIPGDPAHAIAEKLGMEWGGDWSFTDPMHFEIHVPPGGISGVATPVAAPAPADPNAPKPTWVQSILDKIAKGGTGALSGSTHLLTAAPGVYGTTRLMNTVDPTTDFGPTNMARGTAEMVGPVPPGSALERWRPLYAQAMQMLGMFSEPGLEKMMYQMFRESSGDPLSYAIDSNYYAGHPSKGLLQTIPGTFKSNAPDGYNTNIWDPLSNALASLVYVTKRYGGPMGYPGGAYANGGIVGTDTVPARLTPGEAVISPFSAYKDKQKNLVSHAASWFGGEVSYPDGRSLTPVVINVAAPQVQVFIGNEQITNHVSVVVDGKLANVAAKVNRMGAQG